MKILVHCGHVYETNDQGLIDHEAHRLFNEGHCHSLAFALHKLTNWPIFGAVYDFEDNLPGHTLVLSPEGWLDIDGLHDVAYWDDCRRLNESHFKAWLPKPGQESGFYFPANVEMAMPYAKTLLRLYFGPESAKAAIAGGSW